MLLIDPYNGYICNSDTKVDQTHKEKKSGDTLNWEEI